MEYSNPSNQAESPATEGDELLNDLSKELDEVKNKMDDLAAGKAMAEMSIKEMQSSIASLASTVANVASQSQPGSDSTVPPEEDIECLSGGDDATAWAFGVTVKGKVVTIQAGQVRIDGMAVNPVNFDIAKTTLTISGTSSYVFIVVKMVMLNGYPELVYIADTLPAGSNDTIYRGLVRLKYVVTGDKYMPDPPAYILHRGNVHWTVPLAFA